MLPGIGILWKMKRPVSSDRGMESRRQECLGQLRQDQLSQEPLGRQGTAFRNFGEHDDGTRHGGMATHFIFKALDLICRGKDFKITETILILCLLTQTQLLKTLFPHLLFLCHLISFTNRLMVIVLENSKVSVTCLIVAIFFMIILLPFM